MQWYLFLYNAFADLIQFQDEIGDLIVETVARMRSPILFQIYS